MKWFKRIFLIFMAIILFTSKLETVYASELDNPQEYRQNVFEMPVESNGIAGWPQAPGTYGEAAIVMEAETGAVLYAKNIDAHYYPASITKLLTTLVAVENGNFNDKVTFSEDSLSFLEYGDACIGMKVGNVISLEQALYAVLLASANEVSYAVGESVGKNAGHDYNWFIGQMNERCKELGGTNSNFVNTNGLHDDNHYTCARDMALITCELFKHPEVLAIMQTLQFEIEESKTTEEHVFQQNHKMLYPDNEYYYEYAVGGKTGFTDQAYSTLVTMADDGDMELVCVVLKTIGPDVYPDTRNLFDYAYNNFTIVDIAENEKSEDIEQIYIEDEGGYVVLPKNVPFEELDMEITPDEEIYGDATLAYTYEGNYVGGARAELSASYLKKMNADTEKKTKDDKGKNNQKEEEDGKTNTEKIILAGAIVLFIILVTIFVRMTLNRKRNNKHHRK